MRTRKKENKWNQNRLWQRFIPSKNQTEIQCLAIAKEWDEERKNDIRWIDFRNDKWKYLPHSAYRCKWQILTLTKRAIYDQITSCSLACGMHKYKQTKTFRVKKVYRDAAHSRNISTNRETESKKNNNENTLASVKLSKQSNQIVWEHSNRGNMDRLLLAFWWFNDLRLLRTTNFKRGKFRQRRVKPNKVNKRLSIDRKRWTNIEFARVSVNTF